MQKYRNAFPLLLVGSALCLLMAFTACTKPKPVAAAKGHNLIVMVPDGCSQSIQTLARWYKGTPLHLDGLNSGSAKTYMANSVITGSAAAATAFASGHKTTARFVGVGPRRNDLLEGFKPTAAPYEPVVSLLEAAKLSGKATGLVATSRISHATPAAYASHVHDRGMDNEIIEQMVHQDIDVVFGGGARYLIPMGHSHTTTFDRSWQGKRTDGENLLTALKNRGYQWIDNKTALAALSHGPVWGLFSDNHLTPHMDKAFLNPSQPSIAEMTAKAIEILSKDPDGFFLLVEGSQVDWAGHAMDAAYMVNEFLAFDDAVGKALDFASKNGNTHLYIWPDHNTGALSIGNYATYFYPGYPAHNDMRPVYTATTIADLVAPLKKMRLSAEALAKTIARPDNAADIKKAILTHWEIEATDKDLQEIMTISTLKTNPFQTMELAYAIAEVINRNHTIVGWSSHGHHGEDVPVWSFGPSRLVGTFDNTELAKRSAQALGVNLTWAQDRLYVDLAQVYPQFVLEGGHSGNPLVKIGAQISMPVSKNMLHIGTKVHRLSGVVVHAPLADDGKGKVFIPHDAVELIKQAKTAH